MKQFLSHYPKAALRFLSLLLALLTLVSCDVSTISDEELTKTSNIYAYMYIKDGIDSNYVSQIKIRITDGDKQIINDKIKIFVNEIPLLLTIKNELYYTKKSWYSIDKLPRSTSYYLQILLPDSTLHPLGFIQPARIPDNLNFPTTFSDTEDLALDWQNIPLPAQLTIWRGTRNKISQKYGGNENEPSTIKHPISSNTGQYVLPKSYFEDSVSVTHALNVTLNHTETGLTNPLLLPNSKILYEWEVKQKLQTKL